MCGELLMPDRGESPIPLAWPPHPARRTAATPTTLRAQGSAAGWSPGTRWSSGTEFRSIHGRVPSDDELADALGMTPPQLVARKRDLITSDVTSLNTLVVHDESGSVEQMDVLPTDDESTDPEREATRGEAKERFRRAFAQLDRRQREIVVLLYVKNLTLREIGGVLGISESRVCQIHAKLKTTLKRCLAEDAELLAEVA